MTVKHQTARYSWRDFAPPELQVGPKDPQPVEDLDFMLLRTGILAVRIDRSKPDLTFYMTEDAGISALFRVVYTRLLAFADGSGDGAPQAEEIVYTSALWSYDWTMSQVTLSEDPESGRVATFTLTSTVDLVEQNATATELARPLSTVKDFAQVTLTFTLASRDMNRTDEVGTYQILGGMELKVDISIEVLTPVDGIDFLTIEQILRDDRGTYRPHPDEDDDNTPIDVLRRYTDRAGLKQLIEFRQQGDSPGFYSWVRRAEVTQMDGATEVVDVLAAFMVTDGSMLLYLSYPYDVNTTVIFHDPSLGVYEGDIPFIPDEWEAVFDPLLFGVAVVAAVAVVYGLRARPRRPEEEDLEWEDEFVVPEVPNGPKGPEPPSAQAPVDGIPSLPDEPLQTNGSTMLLQPPPSGQSSTPSQQDPEEWVNWED
jgi:hypothetical protein